MVIIAETITAEAITMAVIMAGAVIMAVVMTNAGMVMTGVKYAIMW
jgi:hypothetical protein